MYCTEDSENSIAPDGGNLGPPFVGAAVGIVLVIVLVIVVGAVLVRRKKKTEYNVSSTNGSPTTIAIPMVGDLTAPLVYSHALTDYCSRAVLGSESNISTFI